jgi:hypothetical protein
MRAARRKRLATQAATAMLAGGILIVTAGAGGSAAAASGNQGGPGFNPHRFGAHSNRVDNPWFPLPVGRTLVYTGTEGGKPAQDIFRITHKTKFVAGVRAAVVNDRVIHGGRVTERPRDFYAQDKAGTVWYLGEATAELNAKGKVKSTEGSFEAGKDGAKGGIFMPANPQVGQSFKQEDYKGHAEDRFKILSLAVSVTTPAASSTQAMLTQETTPLEPGIVDHKYYVQGIGTVLEDTVRGVPPGSERLQLTSVQGP